MLNLRLTHESGEKREPTTRGSLPDNSFFYLFITGLGYNDVVTV